MRSAEKALRGSSSAPPKFKYASKLVEHSMDKLIAEKLAKLNPNTKVGRQLPKWLAKMKKSILKKVSEQTRFIFIEEPTVEAAQNSVKVLATKIKEKEAQVAVRLQTECERARRAIKDCAVWSSTPYVPQCGDLGTGLATKLNRASQLLKPTKESGIKQKAQLENVVKIVHDRLPGIAEKLREQQQQQVLLRQANEQLPYEGTGTQFSQSQPSSSSSASSSSTPARAGRGGGKKGGTPAAKASAAAAAAATSNLSPSKRNSARQTEKNQPLHALQQHLSSRK